MTFFSKYVVRLFSVIFLMHATTILFLTTDIVLSDTSSTCRMPKFEPNKSSRGAFEFNRTINVKTVLFTKSDSCKVCWSADELNLLVARRIMQDLIPKRIPRDFKALLEYINTCVNTVRTKTSGKVTQTMMLALYDALGGYLHSVAIPILNEAYYAGNVDYTIASQLHYHLGAMMTYLGTNGASWTNPCDMSKIPTKVASLPIRMCAVEDACKIFVLLEHPHKVTGELMSANNDSIPVCATGDLKIQIPFLDDNTYPSAVAVPFKDHALFSLMSECSVNLIPKYYIMAMRCLGSKRYSTRDMVTFNHQLHYWIISSVVPHLHELDRWYPGFGGIMRVVETMNRRGLANTEAIRTSIRITTVNYSCCYLKESCNFSDWVSPANTLFWIFAILFALLFLLLLLLCLRCFFMKCCCRRRDEHDVNTLVSLYCGVTEPSSQGNNEKSRLINEKSNAYATGGSSFTGTSVSSVSEEEK